MNNFSIDDNPTDTVEEFKEETAEEVYDEYCLGREIPNEISEYVTSLERKLKIQLEAVKDLLSKTSDNQTLHEKALSKMLINLKS